MAALTLFRMTPGLDHPDTIVANRNDPPLPHFPVHTQGRRLSGFYVDRVVRSKLAGAPNRGEARRSPQ